MSVIKAPAKVSISRRQDSHGPDTIYIEVEDAASGIIVFEGEMTLENFAQALTGFSSRPAEGTFNMTSNIGKKMWRESRYMEVPKDVYNSCIGQGYNERHLPVANYIRQHGNEAGWYLDLYLNSQRTFTYPSGRPDVVGVHYSAYKFVPVEEWEILNAEKNRIEAEERARQQLAAPAKKGRKRG